ncbi:hypothetical protein L249_1050 [Ophiocordyceps polyrhachis-furcata BCC 54312]|uniref:Uncharacterized protein n=1 Tax=Ophiocordyceps polyrhachis-furcata BCC 54312 TaxID=1330021 RepID=A0A367LCB7_9HYPO|nr:hypothetical protein L249_1050 [Ophiocordyceps polyrhachis-furcata BCC 54312]
MLTRRLIPPPTLLCRSYLSSVTYGGLGPAAAGPASQCLALPPNYSPQPSVTYGGLGPAAAGPASQCLALPPN